MDSSSEPHTIAAGLPQGSELSPTFFLIYIDDLLETTNNPIPLQMTEVFHVDDHIVAPENAVRYKSVTNEISNLKASMQISSK